MPIYEYRCANGHSFEVFQSMSDDPVTECEECGAPVERVFHPVAVHFKGSGFYTTDYARKGEGRPAADDSARSRTRTPKKSDSGRRHDSEVRPRDSKADEGLERVRHSSD